jgi:hypothetical protein
VIIYIAHSILSVTLAILIINKLYISKKFTKNNEFHFYNDLFSWEMFFFFIGIGNIITTLSIIIPFTAGVAYFLFKIRIFLLFFAVWNKIIHLEKIMDKITYEKHYFGGIIPCLFTLIFIFIEIPLTILFFIFLGSSLIPYLILILMYKNTSTLDKKASKIIVGIIFLIVGFIFLPDFLETELKTIFLILSPILFIMGDLIIFDSYRREL